MIKKLALIVGAVFLLVGILGFVPAFTTMGMDGMPLLLGLFMVGTVHNIIHILSGVVGVATGLISAQAARLYFQIFGLVYALVTIVGVIQRNTVLGLIHVNFADNLLHLGLSVLLLAIGFGLPRLAATPAEA